MLSNSRILVTGANGFIGKNLVVRLNELPGIHVPTFVRGDDIALLPQLVAQVDAVIHLAGENRPADEAAFMHINAGLTAALCNAIRQEFLATGRHVPLVLASSIQVELDNIYGLSKLAAEGEVKALARDIGNPCVILRLPGVFGKWCKPNYNSVVATFCYNITHNLPIHINEPSTILTLVYVDDVVSALISALVSPIPGCVQANVRPEYTVTVGELAHQIRAFSCFRSTLMSERVGTGFVRALYSTFISNLPHDQFSYELQQHSDSRGVFVEMLKTPDCGQFSYFTAYPGITRGGHYHHSKSEKFLVIKGKALFRHRNLLTNDLIELRTSGGSPQVVDSIPGWMHDITNIGDDEMVVLLWANEIFDKDNPDTVASQI
jgi:UDP-2-acetamido-2,6-beta-L-arabino-hexul-4-ose reductase